MKGERNMIGELSPTKRALRAVQAMRSRMEAMESAQKEAIAVIGMGCRFPGRANTPEAFWQNLRRGVDSITDVPPDRWDVDAWYDPDPDAPGKTTLRQAGFVEGIHDIDAPFFEVSAHAARCLDPHHKLLNEVAWEAFENAGLAPDALHERSVAVFMGLWNFDYWSQLVSREVTELNGFEGGNLHSLAAGRLSHFFNFTGPSMTVDTACSTSLVTIHLACQHLRNGDCDLALAGGVNVILSPETSVVLSKRKVLAADGRSKAFDAAADGFGRGEGCGVVVLKRLTTALADGDRVLAVIRGTAINQDGRSGASGVPNGAAQQAVMREALLRSDVGPEEVHFVEAHGTGTAVGDPIEVEALAGVYGDRSADDPLLLGSVKTNIGHLETASGVAAFIKVVLALHNEAIPPNIHFHTPNPKIPWRDLKLRVVDELRPWPRGGRRRLAAVSSFGISGTNAHLILEEAPAAAPREQRAPVVDRSQHLLTLSAKNRAALLELAGRYQRFLREGPDASLEDICFTALTGREHFRHRLGIVGADKEEMREKLAVFQSERLVSGIAQGTVPKNEPGIAFLFTGQGSQYVGMGRQLYDTAPTFRRAMDRCDELLRSDLDQPLLRVLYPAAGEESPLNETRYTQPALFAVEYALAELLRSWGVTPSLVLGHSVGEYVAACLAGVFSLEEGLRLVAERARLMQALPATGQMVAVFADEQRVMRAIEPFRRQVSLAAINGPANTVISGENEAVAAIVAALEAEGVEFKRLQVSHAFHSPLMEDMLQPFRATAERVSYRAPQLSLISNVSGELDGAALATPDYWVNHVRQPVQFHRAMQQAGRAGSRIFVEIGPKPTLTSLGKSCLDDEDVVWLPTLRQGQDEWQHLLATIAELYVRGASGRGNIDQDYDRQKVVLPNYPFQRQRLCVEPAPRVSRTASVTDVDWLTALVEQDEQDGPHSIVDVLSKSGSYSDDEATLLGKMLQVVVDEHKRRRGARRGIVSEYYDSLSDASILFDRGESRPILNFAPFAEVVPGFSWIRTLTAPDRHPEHYQRILDAQQETRAVLFRHVDLAKCRKVLDFGCGHGTDLVSLAERHSHLELRGFTLSERQQEIGMRAAARAGVEDRVQILQRDSSKDEFPSDNDLVFGFEVACHIKDKHALFANVDRNLNENGVLLLSDFISHAQFDIDHDETSSYLITKDKWADVFAKNHLRVIDCVDISPEVANFLHDPDFDATFKSAEMVQAVETMKSAFHSYSRLGRMLRDGMTSYVLFSVQKQAQHAESDLVRMNLEALSSPLSYREAYPNNWLHEFHWEAMPRADAPSQPAPVTAAGGTWLILADQQGLGNDLADRIEARGGVAVIASAGGGFERTTERRWRLDPGQKEHFEQLLDEISVEVRQPVRYVVHLWSLDVPPPQDMTVESLRRSQMSGCGSALLLVQALARSSETGQARCWIVTRGAVNCEDDRPLSVGQSAVWGFAPTVWQEHPQLRGGLLDLDRDASDDDADLVWREVLDSQGEEQIAYRHGERRVACILPVEPLEPRRIELSADATYLITGGLGALGLHVARWMTQCGARNLVLTGRRAVASHESRPAVDELRQSGARVEVFQADVSDELQMRNVLDQVDSSLPPLKGILHAAGTAGHRPVRDMSIDDMESVFSAKIVGAWVLHQLTRDRDLDLFVCFSSISAFVPTLGAAHYAAANHFLDALAQLRASQGLAAASVAWGPWAGGGMATGEFLTRLARVGMHPLPPNQALDALDYLLSARRASTIVGRVDWELLKTSGSGRILRRLTTREDAQLEATGQTSRVLLQLEQGDPTDRPAVLHDFVRDAVAAVLGFEGSAALDGQSTLLELGFDSLMAVQLRNVLRTDLAIDLPLTELIDKVNIEDVVSRLDQKLALSAVAGEVQSRSDGHEHEVEFI